MANIYDVIRAVTLVVGFGYSAQQDRKTWLWADSVLWGCYAAGIFLFPDSLIPGATSEIMGYLVRIFASLLVGQETMWYLSRRTRDENVVGAILWSRVMGSLILLMVSTYSYMQFGDKFDDKNICFEAVGCAMLLLTSVYQFWRGAYRVGGREDKGHISTIIRINFIILFFTGLLNLTYPSWVIPFKKLDQIESFMMRATGAMFFGWSFMAWYATSFRFDDDKSAFFLSEVLACVMMFISLNLGYFVDGLFSPREALIMHIGILPVFLVLIGLYLLRRKNQDSISYSSSYYLRSKME